MLPARRAVFAVACLLAAFTGAGPAAGQRVVDIPVVPPVSGIPVLPVSPGGLSVSPTLGLSALPNPVLPSALPAVVSAQPVQADYGALRRFFDGGSGPAADFRAGGRSQDLGGGIPSPLGSVGRPQDAGSIAFGSARLPRRQFSDQAQRLSRSIVEAIDNAAESIDLALHGLSLPEVAEALKRAKDRGVRVRIVMNKSHVFPDKAGQKRSREVQFLLDEGFEMRVLRGGGPYGTMHNKFAVFDGRVLEGGSYNWSKAADQYNWENMQFSDDARRVAGYQAYWEWMWRRGRGPAQAELGDLETGEAPPSDPARGVRFKGRAFPAFAFSPGGPAEAELVDIIGLAERSIDLAMFSFTSPELLAALDAAKARGLAIRIVFDRGSAGNLREMRYFIENGYDVTLSNGVDGNRGVMHNKFAVVDGELLETGSYNWTENADKNNYENANFSDDSAEVSAYASYFERVRSRGRRPTAADLRPDAAPENLSTVIED